VEKRKNIIIIFSYNSHIRWCVSIYIYSSWALVQL